MVWTAGWAAMSALIADYVAMCGGESTLADDPSLDNDVLIAQMMRSMQAGF